MRLKLAFHGNLRIQALVDGAVEVPGYELDWTVGHAADLHLVHLTENAFDVRRVRPRGKLPASAASSSVGVGRWPSNRDSMPARIRRVAATESC